MENPPSHGMESRHIWCHHSFNLFKSFLHLELFNNSIYIIHDFVDLDFVWLLKLAQKQMRVEKWSDLEGFSFKNPDRWLAETIETQIWNSNINSFTSSTPSSKHKNIGKNREFFQIQRIDLFLKHTWSPVRKGGETVKWVSWLMQKKLSGKPVHGFWLGDTLISLHFTY